jgi:hypothetical protein
MEVQTHAFTNSAVDGGQVEKYTLWPPYPNEQPLYQRNVGLPVCSAETVIGETREFFTLPFNHIFKNDGIYQ